MPPSLSSSTHYALVIDAGSSGSRLQIYSWRDPDLERAEIVKEVRETYAQARLAAGSSSTWSPPTAVSGSSTGTGTASGSGAGGKWWWPDKPRSWWKGQGKGKGKGKQREDEIELELEEKALRRLVRVGKGVEGDDWIKRVEPGE
jgi:Golgi apyrase